MAVNSKSSSQPEVGGTVVTKGEWKLRRPVRSALDRYIVAFDPLRQQIRKNAWFLSIGLMSIFSLICFLPLMCFGDHYTMAFLNGYPQSHQFFSDIYRLFLLMTILTAIPMVMELMLDWHYTKLTADLNQWFARAIFLGALIVPNVILLAMTKKSQEPLHPFVPQAQLSLFLSQQVFIIGSFFCTLFGQDHSSVSNPNDKLTINFEERTVFFLFTFVIGKIFLFLSAFDSSNSYSLSAIGLTMIGFAVVQIIIALTGGLSFFYRQLENWKFRSHTHMSGFYHLLSLLAFVIFDFIFLGISRRFIDINPQAPNFQSRVQPTDGVFVVEFLYIQLALTYFLTVIPGRSHLLSAQLKQEKLNIRLNLIRYVSHEMRTPLNTAFLGLGMLSTQLQELKHRVNATANQRHALYNHQLEMLQHNKSVAAHHGKTSRRSSLRGSAEVKETVHQAFLEGALPTHGSQDTTDPALHHNSPTISMRSEGQGLHWMPQCRPEVAPHSPTLSVADMMSMYDHMLTLTDCEDMQDTVRQVLDSCKVALETLNDLLTFDKLDENKLVVELQKINPWELLCETASPFDINAREANVNFSVSCQSMESDWMSKCFIKADKFKLAQVVRNLISNALKFTPPEGNVRVKLERIDVSEHELMALQEREREKNVLSDKESEGVVRSGSAVDVEAPAPKAADVPLALLRLSVEDSGAGISKENQKRLFGQYVQFNAGALQQGKGSGLGLWIAKSIVEMHGGKIRGESVGEGRGSTFSIDLPVFLREGETIACLPQVSSLQTQTADSTDSITPNDANDESNRLKSSSSCWGNICAIFSTEKKKQFQGQSLLSHEVLLRDADSRSSLARKREHSLFGGHLFSPRNRFTFGDALHAPGQLMSRIFVHGNITTIPVFRYGDATTGRSDLESGRFNPELAVEEVQSERIETNSRQPSSYLLESSSMRSRPSSAWSLTSKIIPVMDPDDDLGPVSPLPNSNAVDPLASSSVSLIPKVKSSGFTFLLVDDSIPNRKMMRKLLTNLGHNVYECGDGIECLEFLGYSDFVPTAKNMPRSLSVSIRISEKKMELKPPTAHIDIVLIDDHMPRMNGTDATKILKSNGFSGIIFAVTGTAGSEDSSDVFLQNGAQSVFGKPLDLKKLQLELDRIAKPAVEN